ncbi:hypothetical protein M1L60_14260 [Actinoplanes sp. TRM 88003]|uniref:Capsular polysaccharide biosynthesis protein n=1 Tax=Paractinoplanes aksuensis TaxID=2939490 RepID=A0ABT1DLP8_9ACTN|nr:hypothetical protein [Actinoplanes aksuensis]MCO8271757.1 hypothetical protein [Actinoplanes aksuensis]
MDFWDLTKLVFRRWYVALPLLVATGLFAVDTAKTVQPDYKATAYVQLIPPPEASITENIKALRNPWLDLGLGSLATASTYATVDKKFLNELKTKGMSDNVVIEAGYPEPIATIEVIGTSQQMATTTADAVVAKFTSIVRSLQDDYAVKTPGRILTRRLDTGNNLEETGGKVKRALVAVLGAGALATGGITVAFDALMRRRSRRKALREEGVAPETTSAPPPAKPAAATTSPQPREADAEAGLQTVRLPVSNGAKTNGSAEGKLPGDSTVRLPSSVYPKPSKETGSKR